MDVKAYIESGVLEQYVLGALNESERRDVERYAASYPAIRQELDQIEQAMETYALMHGKTPPAGTLERILSKIDAGNMATNSGNGTSTVPAQRGFSWTKFLAVGMTIKFILTLSGLLYVFFRNQALHNQLEAQQQQQIVAQSVCDSIATEFNQLRDELIFFKDPNTRPVALIGQPPAPDAEAAVYFNPNNRRVYLSSLNLPVPPSGKQYQLWAIKSNGTPVSLGVFNISNNKDAFIEFPFVEGAKTFAISLENAGGVAQPTIGQIYVMGSTG